jgi:DNA-binding response OmpR family regulator
MQILLVEPDKILANTYILALEKSGHSVLWQTSADGAIKSVDQKVPEIIILEVQLAQHSGIEFLFELRSYIDLDKVLVVLNTTVAEHELGLNLAAKKQLGIAGYLYKPHTSLNKLLYTINSLAKVWTA